MNQNSFQNEPKTPPPLGAQAMRWVIAQPGTAWGFLIILTLALVIGLVLVGMNRRVILEVGQVADRTKVTRVPVQVDDSLATDADRQAARRDAPKVYSVDAVLLTALADGVANLPVALADPTSIDQVDPAIRERFALTETSLRLLQSQAAGGKPTPAWRRRADKLADLLRTTPLVDNETYQQGVLTPGERVELVVEGMPPVNLRSADLINIDGRRLDAQLRMLALSAGFAGEEIDAVVNSILESKAPTFRLDRALTQQRAELAAAGVQPRGVRFNAGEVLFTRGDVITASKLEVARGESQAYWTHGQAYQRYAEVAALMGLSAMIALGLGAYVSAYSPKLFARSRRLAALALLFAGALGVSCLWAILQPRAAVAAVCVPPVLVAAILVVAYERRTALAIASLLGLASVLAVRLPIEAGVLPLAGVALIVWQLREIRHRGTLIRAGFVAGLLLAAITLLVEQLRLPMSQPALTQTAFSATLAGIGVLLACFVVLGLLPSIERSFGVLTPLSLIELRDPRHPLLQMLQQRAPGTWVHSMNVANLTEQACQRIGADGLLAYVGALYHDAGKMNRPEMFVENQSGINRHDKLTPSMSLLLIVAHVADGMELAREHHIPAPLWHFIEAHHGTTVVEYFYHRARKQHDQARSQAVASLADAPEEGQYRYPGPKPRTKEVAVMMVCDAAEGAARAMPDPTPIKIEQMVRSIAERRLADGQFDQCELTMKEIGAVVQTISKSLASIHHGRVPYPEGTHTGKDRRPATGVVVAATGSVVSAG